MKPIELIDAQEVLEQDLQEDPAFREFWEHTAPARAVANGLIAHRIAHNLTQTELAARLGVKQPRVARLELGEHNSTWDTLWLLTSKLGLSFLVAIAPHAASPRSHRPIWRSPDVVEFARGAAVEEVVSPVDGTQAFVAVRASES